MKTSKLNWQSAWLVHEASGYEDDFRGFDTEEDAVDYFRSCVQYALDRDEEETDANGRTIDECVEDREADFGDCGVTLTEISLYTRKENWERSVSA